MSQRHATDVVALVFGTMFAGFTAVWLFWLNGQVHDNMWWVGPVVLIGAGAVGLVAALRPSRPEEPGRLDSPPTA